MKKHFDVQWVVNDLAELGVKVGDDYHFLYKGESIIYKNGLHDDGTPMHVRPVGKREFGECCHPVMMILNNRITVYDPLNPDHGLHDFFRQNPGPIPGGGWIELPPSKHPEAV